MNIEINGIEYEYISSIVDNDAVRTKFVEFINEAFEFNFQAWYEAGFWTKKYEPHVLIKDNQVVSTVTVNHMKYRFGEEIKTYIQIGGVLTREAYYKKGLARWLMSHIIEQYKDQCEQIFLFSDDFAVEFYPKMGFKKVIEYIASYEWNNKTYRIPYNKDILNVADNNVRKLNIADEKDRNLLLACYKQSNPFSKFPSVDCEELVVFYGLEFKKDCFYYFEELDTVVIAKLKEKELYLYDIYGSPSFDIKKDGTKLLDLMIQSILEQNHCTKENLTVQLGFSPIAELPNITLKPFIQKDDTTYLLDGKENIFEQNKLRFPVLSHN